MKSFKKLFNNINLTRFLSFIFFVLIIVLLYLLYNHKIIEGSRVMMVPYKGGPRITPYNHLPYNNKNYINDMLKHRGGNSKIIMGARGKANNRFGLQGNNVGQRRYNDRVAPDITHLTNVRNNNVGQRRYRQQSYYDRVAPDITHLTNVRNANPRIGNPKYIYSKDVLKLTPDQALRQQNFEKVMKEIKQINNRVAPDITHLTLPRNLRPEQASRQQIFDNVKTKLLFGGPNLKSNLKVVQSTSRPSKDPSYVPPGGVPVVGGIYGRF